MVMKTFNVIVTAGQATGGPPIGPLIGPLGVNIMAIVNKINEVTASFNGTKIPVDITIDTDTKDFTIRTGMLTTTALIMREVNIAKGSGKPNTEPAGDISLEQIINIARMKKEGLLAFSLKAAAREILGSCQSLGITVGGRSAKQIQQEVAQGKFDELLVDSV